MPAGGVIVDAVPFVKARWRVVLTVDHQSSLQDHKKDLGVVGSPFGIGGQLACPDARPNRDHPSIRKIAAQELVVASCRERVDAVIGARDAPSGRAPQRLRRLEKVAETQPQALRYLAQRRDGWRQVLPLDF
jgi:hypothetical protein